MESLDRTMLLWENYSPLERFIIETACNLMDVPVDRIINNSKNRKVVTAKALIARVLSEQNYSSTEVGKVLGVSQRMAYEYIHSHENRMADGMYSFNYNKLIGILKQSSEDSSDLSQVVDNMSSRVARLEQRVNHLSKLILE
jgi:predicted transcriptional regulator